MSNRLNDLYNKGEQDVARRREHAGVTDDLIRIIGGSDAYDNTPNDKQGRDAYKTGLRNAKKRTILMQRARFDAGAFCAR